MNVTNQETGIEEMTPIREAVLLSIYDVFADWSAGFPHTCQAGCAVCCTRNVMATAVEGELIHRSIREQGGQEWFVARLQEKGITTRARMTTNEYAGFCLRGEDVVVEEGGSQLPCPFLDQDRCLVYEVRPFVCRSFASQETCRPGLSALLPPEYLAASIAVQQIIEHLGQGEYWGNLLDVLTALCDLPENKQCMTFLSPSFVEQARVQLIKARPLPGFLLLEEESSQVAPLLQAIFSRKIGEKTVEEILNGR